MELLRFTASWCQPCKMLAKSLEGEDLGVNITVIDIDESPDKVQEHGIRSVPTLVLLPSGKKLVGIKTAQEIKDWIAS